MRRTRFAIVLSLLLIGSLPAFADSFRMAASGGAYDVQGASGFSFTGPEFTMTAANDFGPGDIGGLLAGHSYNLSYTVWSNSFSGYYGGGAITGNGSITWQFTVSVPNVPGGEISLQVPGMVAGTFRFCSPAEYGGASSCGPGDNSLGTGAFGGIGMDTLDLNCTDSGTCSIYANYLEPYTAIAQMNVVPEPSTLMLVLASLLAYPAFFYARRRRLERVRPT